MEKKYLLIILHFFCIVFYSEGKQVKKANNLFEKIILISISNPTNGKTESYGSGFLLNKNDNLFLITAKHVLFGKNLDGIKISFNSNNKVLEYDLKNLIKDTKLDIVNNAYADILICKITTNDQSIMDMLYRASFDESIIKLNSSIKEKIINRNIEVVSLGFPNYDINNFFPISIRANIASSLITYTPEKDSNKQCKVYLIDKPCAQGSSGGPVFLYVKNMSKFNPRKIKLLGLNSATTNDETGGKLGIIIHSNYIQETINYWINNLSKVH